MDLDKLNRIKISAGESAVIESLRAKGLIPKPEETETKPTTAEEIEKEITSYHEQEKRTFGNGFKCGVEFATLRNQEQAEECSHEPLIDTGVGYNYCPACKQSWDTRNQQKWIPVSERLPEANDLVLCSNVEDKWVVAGYLAITGLWYNQFQDEYSDPDVIPTHWMPLPEQPKQ